MTGGKKFGGGRVPTGTPSLAWSSVVIVVSLLAGASVVHNIYKPDMVSFPPPGRCANHLFDGIPLWRPAHFIFSVIQTIPPVESATGEGSGNSSQKS
jgi:hypothetical protein